VLLRLAGGAIRKSPTPRLGAIGFGTAEDLAGGVQSAAQLLALAGEIRIRFPRLHAHLAGKVADRLHRHLVTLGRIAGHEAPIPANTPRGKVQAAPVEGSQSGAALQEASRLTVQAAGFTGTRLAPFAPIRG